MLRQQIITAALAAVCFASCIKSKNEVTITNRNFENEIEQQQNLVFTFDRDLVADSLTGFWDTTTYARITPPVRGQFKWSSKKELMFSPYTGFRPSTDYKVELVPTVLKHTHKSYFLPEEKMFLFHTPYLKLVSAFGFWAVSEKNKGEAALKISLVFNYKVDPGTVSKLVHISMNGQDKTFTVTTPEVNETVTAVIDGIDRDKLASVPLAVEIDKGLKCVDSDYLTKENLGFASVVPSPDKLEITQATGEYDAADAVVHVFATQAVDENKIAQYISTEPKVKFSVEMAADGFFLKGGFTAGLSYQVTITKQLRGMLGGEMEKDFTQLVVFGALEPSISFVSKKGIYLSSAGAKNIAVNIVSVPKVRVTIKKVYENNIVHFMRSNRYHSYEDYYYDEEDEEGGYNGYRYNTYNAANYSDVVFDQWYETRSLPKQNGVYLLNLSMEDEKKYKGIYLVNVSSTDDLYRNDTKLVSISDIGLITKQTENELYVFANSIKTAEPMRGVEISFISTNNQDIYTATTNSDGIAEFTNVRAKVPFTVAMVTAKQYGDFNYLLLDDSRISSSRFDVGGRRTNSIGYMAFLYGDRNIYRPGETIYLNTIVRDEQWSPIGEVPVKIKMLLPNGKEYKAVKGTLDPQGAFTTSFPLPAATVTGTYVAEVYSANDVLLQSRDISVEEFMPDRISVNLKLNQEDFSYNDTVTASVTAMNLFGPPAAGRKYEMEYSLTYKYFSSKDFKGYNFSISRGKDVRFPNDLRGGETDENGNAHEDFKVDTFYKNIGALEGKIFATVFDETGRPVNRLTHFDVFTQDVFFGMKMTDYYVPTGNEYAIPLIAVDKNGKARNAKAQVQIVRHDWFSIIERTEGGGYHWVSRENDRIVLDQEITLGKEGYVLNYRPRESGNFEVRIMAVGVTNYVSGYFYSYGHGYTSNTSFAVNTEGQVDITFDKEKYNVGDEANILFTAPFSGKLLVTVECDKLLKSFYLETDKKTASVAIPVEENYLPNVYITATLFRPLDDGAIPMTVAHGFAPMIVNKESNSLPVTITAVEQSRSRTKQKITVKTKPIEDVELTVAIVDEGILQLKNYRTPDPYAFFYQKKALEVTSYDLYATLLPDLKLKRSSPGGDGYDLEKRVNPLTNKRVKLVAFWSGLLHTNAAGEASYTIDIPQFSGDLRIMVCAYKDKAFGSADRHMKVADPIVISPSIPRFLSPKDTLVMPVTLTNTTSNAAEATAKVSLTGALTMASAAQQTVTIKPKSEQRVEFKILAATAIGAGTIGIGVNAFGENFSDMTDITVRPSTSLLKVSDDGVIKGNTSKTLKLKTDFIPSTVKSKLIISQNPMIQFTDQLNYLLGYPYGCLEQTTSKAFPQIYYTELVRNVKNAVGTTENPQFYVQEAVRKLETMQLYNGSLSYWPGGIYENWWGTTYATHFLYEAQKAGYEVNPYILDRCMTYIEQKVKEHLTFTYYYWDGKDMLRSKTIAWKENCYSLYILALYSKPDISSMNYYKSHLELLALDSRYLLACTYLAVGDRKSYYELLPKAFEGERSRTCFGGSFYSYVRDEAIALNALLENDPDNPQIGIMVKHLTQQLKKDRYLNTQERAFTFLALGKFMKRQRENKVTASIMVDGIPVDSFTGKEVILTKNISGKRVEVNVSGYGNLYYFWEEEGINAKGEFKEEDSYLKVRKGFYNRFGQPVSIKNIKQGDLLAVKISVQALEKVTVENVVLTDMLPAGFEIENPRVGEVQDMNWIKDESTPDYFDVRDDRINFFTTVDTNVRNYYYLVRAVSLGNYVMGPVSADAMYDGEYHSYNGAGVVRVVR